MAKKSEVGGLTLKDLGFTKEQLQERLIEKMASDLFSGMGADEDGGEYTVKSSFRRKMDKRLVEIIDEKIDALAQKYLLPNVSDYLEDLCLEETNKWGESTGKKLTFVEYLVERANAYMREEVDYEGKTKSQCGSFSSSWQATGTRVAHMIHKYLHYSIEQAMTGALADANNSIVGGLEDAVKIQLEEVRKKLKVSVKTGR